MELQQESSKFGVLSAGPSRNLSSSSSVFVSANQSPFFSPRYLQVQPEITQSAAVSILSTDPLGSGTLIRRSESSINTKFLASDACREPRFSASGEFETPRAAIGHNTRARGSRGRSLRKLSSSQPSANSRLGSCDVYIAFHGRKPSLLRFTKWLRSELELQGISCFASDRARCRNSRSLCIAERAMNASTFGVVILTKKSFGNPYTMEELRNFLGKKNLLPVFFDLSPCDCLSRDIIERRGEMWEKDGGELWLLYGGIEKEWREAVDGLSRTQDCRLEAFDGEWRDCILKAVVLLATKLGRRSVVDGINRWKERVEKEEFPFPRNEEFVGRKKELSELELILFGEIDGDGEKDYIELKMRQRQKSSLDCQEEEEGDEESRCSKGKEAVLWKESENEIEMQRLGRSQFRMRSTKGSRRNSMRSRKAPAMNKVAMCGRGIACVSGDSGIGKTELALEYAYRFFQRYKMVLWVGGESRYILQNYLNLRAYFQVEPSSGIESGCYSLEKGKVKCFEEQEEEALGKVRKELMRDIPFLIVIDNLESEKDWWEQRVIMDLLPRFGGETHVIITTRLPRVMNLEPMKLSYLSGVEALALMKGSVKDYPIAEIDAMRVIEEKIGRLTLALGIVGAILSELPITPSRLLDTINRMPAREPTWSDREAPVLRRHPFLLQLLDVCLSIFDHADGPRSLATRMVQVCSWFAPAAIPVPLLSMAAHKVAGKKRGGGGGSRFWKKLLHAVKLLPCSNITSSRNKRSEAEAASMLVRFGIARSSSRAECVQFHEIIKLYACKRGAAARTSHAMLQAVCQLRGSVSLCSEHMWASCFLLLGFASDPVVISEPKPPELLFFVRRVALPLAVHAFVSLSRCTAALELLCRCTDALEAAADAMASRAEKWHDRAMCCSAGPPAIRSKARYAGLWRELALLKATVLETRAKLMIKGGLYDTADGLVRSAIFIRTSIYGEHHPDTVSARETLGRVTRLLTNFPT